MSIIKGSDKLTDPFPDYFFIYQFILPVVSMCVYARLQTDCSEQQWALNLNSRSNRKYYYV